MLYLTSLCIRYNISVADNVVDMCNCSTMHLTMFYVCMCVFSDADFSHVTEEEVAAVKQPHPAPDLLAGGHGGQRPREHRHPQPNRV